jgi:histidinol-phosphate phosphatase family protein
VVWVVSHLADDVIRRVSPLSNNVEVVVDGGHGTARALRQVRPMIQGETVMILLADCIMGLPLRKVVDGLAETSSTIFFGRETDHPEDSDVLILDATGAVIGFQSKGLLNKAESGLFYGLSGITITNQGALEQPLEAEDFQLDIYLNSLKLKKSIALIKNSWYVRDTGTASRLFRVQKDFATGSFHRRARCSRSAIFLDRDGTLVPNIGECRKSVLPGEVPTAVVQEINSANQRGIPIILVTNQPGIAKGCLSYAEFLNSLIGLRAALGGAFLDDYYFCPHHPETGWPGEVRELKVECNCRKPKPGMLLEAAKQHDLELGQSVFIGDSLADMAAAASSGTHFKSAEWSEDGAILATAIRTSVREMARDID